MSYTWERVAREVRDGGRRFCVNNGTVANGTVV